MNHSHSPMARVHLAGFCLEQTASHWGISGFAHQSRLQRPPRLVSTLGKNQQHLGSFRLDFSNHFIHQGERWVALQNFPSCPIQGTGIYFLRPERDRLGILGNSKSIETRAPTWQLFEELWVDIHSKRIILSSHPHSNTCTLWIFGLLGTDPLTAPLTPLLGASLGFWSSLLLGILLWTFVLHFWKNLRTVGLRAIYPWRILGQQICTLPIIVL